MLESSDCRYGDEDGEEIGRRVTGTGPARWTLTSRRWNRILRVIRHRVGGRTTMPTTHQPDQDVFRSVLPEDVDWEPFAPFPPTARLAVLVGHPTEPGPYVIRVKVPSGV